MHSESDIKARQIEETIGQLNKIYADISDDNLRIWLLRELMKRNLSTRDIYSFINGQAKLRTDLKLLDYKTMTSAMRTKLNDIKKKLSRKIKKKLTLEDELDEEVVKMNTKKHKKENKKRSREIEKKYKMKIAHYTLKQKQKIVKCARKKKNFIKRTEVPENMKDFKKLVVFKDPCDLPRPQKPKGPFICDHTIKLDPEELVILNKDPKFSICRKVELLNFLLEVEKMLSKHRYSRSGVKNKENLDRIKCITSDRVQQLLEEANIDNSLDHVSRRREIKKRWEEEKHRFVFNPLTQTINFNSRRATDYKLNKNVNLPKPLTCEEEFECETRKQAFIETYKDHYKVPPSKVDQCDKEKKKEKEEMYY